MEYGGGIDGTDSGWYADRASGVAREPGPATWGGRPRCLAAQAGMWSRRTSSSPGQRSVQPESPRSWCRSAGFSFAQRPLACPHLFERLNAPVDVPQQASCCPREGGASLPDDDLTDEELLELGIDPELNTWVDRIMRALKE